MITNNTTNYCSSSKYENS